MPTTPSVSELAEAARTSPAFAHAILLAEWVGDGRAVTPKGMLKQGDIAAACKLLGLAVRRTPQRLSYLPDLHLPWLAAVGAGLLRIEGTRAVATDILRALPDQTDEQVLELWLAALMATASDAPEPRLRRSGIALALAAFRHTGPGDGFDQWRYILINLLRSDDGAALELAGSYRSLNGVFDYTEHAPERMAMFRAVENFQLSPLGAWALHALTPPTIAATAGAAEVLRVAVSAEMYDAYELCRPWMDARDPGAAASELLTAAAQMDASHRYLALDLAGTLDVSLDGTVRAWQEAAEDPALGPAARLHLWNLNLLEKLQPDDMLLLQIEDLALALAAGDDVDLVDLFHTLDGPDPQTKLQQVVDSEHPDSRAVGARLRELAVLTRPQRLYQLKIKLQGWGSWRRILLSPATSLGELHYLIRILFDWDDDHLHLFAAGERHYGDPARDPESGDEYDTTLRRILPRIGTVVRYTYDLGDSWDHEITLERIADATPGSSYPLCTAGHGDNPIEDSWVEEGQDYPTTPFDIAAVNRMFDTVGGA